MSLLQNTMAKSGGDFYNGVATTSFRNIPGATLTFEQGTPTSATTFCMGGWFKRQNNAFYSNIFSAELGGSGVAAGIFAVSDDDTMFFYDKQSSDTFRLITDREFRDTSAWYHVWMRVELGNGTAGERVQLWVNGVRETSFSTETYPTASVCKGWNVSGKDLYMGHSNASYGGNVYMSDWYFIDGASVSPVDTVGEFKNGIFIPKAYSPTFGDNGFHLKFDQVGVGTASTSTIGADTSGNTNHFTSTANTDVVARDCALPDSPENNFCTMNPLDTVGTIESSEGNLEIDSVGDNENINGTMAVSTGKWYWEVRADSVNASFIGVKWMDGDNTQKHWENGQGISYYSSNGNKYAINGGESYGDAYSSGEIISIALDMDAETLIFYNEGVAQATIDFSSRSEYTLLAPALSAAANSAAYTMNFGADGTFAGAETAQGNTDANGIGNFYYAPPSGYLALCTANLPEPTIGPNSDTQSDDHFNTVLFTGGSGDVAVSGVGFQPDWVWIKARSNAQGHSMGDSNRGGTKLYGPHANAGDSDVDELHFTSDGFTSNTDWHTNNYTYVAWNWKANGGTTSTLTDGSINTTVQANTTAGFSIMTFVSDQQNGTTLAHGLGAVPAWFILKSRDEDNAFYQYHKGIGEGEFVMWGAGSLGVAAEEASTSTWGNTVPTTTLVTAGIGSMSLDSGHNIVGYAFAEVEGFSKFGSYTGNNATDGNFIFTNFSPALVIIKFVDGSAGGTKNWTMWDNKRSPQNVNDNTLFSNTNAAEGADSAFDIDLLSNGFKLRNAEGPVNNGAVYIYMAFAEAPFKYANAR